MRLDVLWEGLKFCGLAQGMVFAVLAILGGLIALFHVLLHRGGREQPSPPQEAQVTSRPPAAAASLPPMSGGGKLALVAAIAAAYHHARQPPAARPPAAFGESRGGSPGDFWRLRTRRSTINMAKRNRRWSNG